jgi:hypothetical protein
MRAGQPCQRSISRSQFFDPLGHRRRRRDRVDANSLWCIGDSRRTGDCGDAGCESGPPCYVNGMKEKPPRGSDRILAILFAPAPPPRSLASSTFGACARRQ